MQTYHICALCHIAKLLSLIVPEMEIVEFANSVDPDEAANKDVPHMNLHCLPSNL